MLDLIVTIVTSLIISKYNRHPIVTYRNLTVTTVTNYTTPKSITNKTIPPSPKNISSPADLKRQG